MADDRTSIIEETASTIFDGPDSPFDGLAFSVDCLKQSMDESICEEFQCFKSSLIRFLFGEENNDYAPKKPFDFENLSRDCQKKTIARKTRRIFRVFTQEAIKYRKMRNPRSESIKKTEKEIKSFFLFN